MLYLKLMRFRVINPLICNECMLAIRSTSEGEQAYNTTLSLLDNERGEALSYRSPLRKVEEAPNSSNSRRRRSRRLHGYSLNEVSQPHIFISKLKFLYFGLLNCISLWMCFVRRISASIKFIHHKNKQACYCNRIYHVINYLYECKN